MDTTGLLSHLLDVSENKWKYSYDGWRNVPSGDLIIKCKDTEGTYYYPVEYGAFYLKIYLIK